MNCVKVLTMLPICVFAATTVFASHVITEVSASQRYPWNGKVDICFTLSGTDEVSRSLAVVAIDQNAGITNYANSITGDTGYVNGAHHIVWDMSADGFDIVSTNVVFGVAYVEASPLYCVVDLAGGTAASIYPVSYLSDVPTGGWTSEHKTTKLILRRIQPGKFMMGSPIDELGHLNNETQHEVTISKGFWMGVFQVTQRQWELVMGSKPAYSKSDDHPVEQVTYNNIRGTSKGSQWPSSSDVDESSFMGVLRTKTGLAFDLPTESQWEYSCRAGTTTSLNSGKNIANTVSDTELDKLGRYYRNNGGYASAHASVGSYKENAWGLYDMHGNVWEWCLDWYHDYTADSVVDPKGATSGTERVLRGGSWGNDSSGCRSANRTFYEPSLVHWHFGLRVASEISSDASMTTQAEGEEYACSERTVLDLSVGTRVAKCIETLTYSTEWASPVPADATAVIKVNGIELCAKAGRGTIEWLPKTNGIYALTHQVLSGESVQGETLTATFSVGHIPDSPSFLPVDGTIFADTQKVTISSTNENAEIYYTLDGSEPTRSSNRYTSKFRISTKTIVKAIVVVEGQGQSAVATASYAKGVCPEPVISSESGVEFHGTRNLITITYDGGEGVVHYTLDGSDPTVDSPIYEGPFSITDTATIKAKAISDLFFNSSVVSVTFTNVWGIGDALNVPDQEFESSGDANWVRDNDTTHDGVESLRSGAIDNYGISTFSTVITGRGTVSFWWKTSCEDGEGYYDCDRVEFSADGKVYQLDAESDWQQVQHTFTVGGDHTLVWSYIKDESESKGSDCAWVDEFVWDRIDPLPDLGSDPSDVEVADAMSEARDPSLPEHVVSGADYVAFRNWANELLADGVTHANVIDSPYSWLSYGLNSSALLKRVPTSEEIHIESFAQQSEIGVFDFTVKLDDITVGNAAIEEHLRSLFSVEGSTTVNGDYDLDSVAITTMAAEDGCVKVTAGPADPNESTFFMRVRLNP